MVLFCISESRLGHPVCLPSGVFVVSAETGIVLLGWRGENFSHCPKVVFQRSCRFLTPHVHTFLKVRVKNHDAAIPGTGGIQYFWILARCEQDCSDSKVVYTQVRLVLGTRKEIRWFSARRKQVLLNLCDVFSLMEFSETAWRDAMNVRALHESWCQESC